MCFLIHKSIFLRVIKFGTLWQHITMAQWVSGAEYAYGYLSATEKSKNPRNRVVGAVNSAIKFSPTCMGPVDVVSI